MPFVANTPESLLGRTDSLNPNLTCRGITSNGRPCRRPVSGAKPGDSSSLRPTTPNNNNPREEGLYCWQHKDQASLSAHSSPGPRVSATPVLEGRSSIDTLADRLGLIDLQGKPKRKTSANGSGTYKPATTYLSSRPSKKQSKSLVLCCCFSVPIEEVPETRPPRPQPRPVQRTSIPVPPPSKRNSRVHSSSISTKEPIPESLDPTVASALRAELARPWTDSEEPGFIYMFWLTKASDATPPVDAARSLLAPPSPARPNGSGSTRSRRASDVVSNFANPSSSANANGKKTMMLKIGRAQNVQRRMNQWQRQCGYDIEMLRYYPYLSNASESSGVVPHMTGHCHRVERLVHIELGGLGMRCKNGTCDACGREHREWFEVEATREGIRMVDEIIRRWIGWDETNA